MAIRHIVFIAPTKCFEGADFDVVLKFYDLTGAGEIPATLKWQVYDKDTGFSMIVEQTVAVPAQTVTITMTAAVNAMNDETKPSEVRSLEVRTTHAGGRVFNELYEYGLYNLVGA